MTHSVGSPFLDDTAFKFLAMHFGIVWKIKQNEFPQEKSHDKEFNSLGSSRRPKRIAFVLNPISYIRKFFKINKIFLFFVSEFSSPEDTQRRFDVRKTFFDRYGRWMNFKVTP